MNMDVSMTEMAEWKVEATAVRQYETTPEAEQMEMNSAAMFPEPDLSEIEEQAEMDRAVGLGGEQSPGNTLGEYRVFCDTRPVVSRYATFCKR